MQVFVRRNDLDEDGVINEEDCDDTDSSSTIKANDADCDGIEASTDCDDSDPSMPLFDEDCDGSLASEDCDDNNSEIYPEAEELFCDNIDNNCNNINDEGLDPSENFESSLEEALDAPANIVDYVPTPGGLYEEGDYFTISGYLTYENDFDGYAFFLSDPDSLSLDEDLRCTVIPPPNVDIAVYVSGKDYAPPDDDGNRSDDLYPTVDELGVGGIETFYKSDYLSNETGTYRIVIHAQSGENCPMTTPSEENSYTLTCIID